MMNPACVPFKDWVCKVRPLGLLGLLTKAGPAGGRFRTLRCLRLGGKVMKLSSPGQLFLGLPISCTEVSDVMRMSVATMGTPNFCARPSLT